MSGRKSEVQRGSTVGPRLHLKFFSLRISHYHGHGWEGDGHTLQKKEGKVEGGFLILPNVLIWANQKSGEDLDIHQIPEDNLSLEPELCIITVIVCKTDSRTLLDFLKSIYCRITDDTLASLDANIEHSILYKYEHWQYMTMLNRNPEYFEYWGSTCWDPSRISVPLSIK